MAEIKVNLGPSSYDIKIGTNHLASLGELLRSMKLTNQALVVTDGNVSLLYGSDLQHILSDAGFLVHTHVVAPGEQSKALDIAADLYTKAIECKLDRHSPVIALGGGVVGDLAGFFAATYLRGVPFIQIPTTLLAQVDSSIGGKVAVNHPLGKNLIGSFYQPKIVLIDTKFIDTLPERELATGLAEIIKHGIIADRDYFFQLDINYKQILQKKQSLLPGIIERSCQIKANVVQQDEHESHLRMILNFGHTIAHAIEAATAFVSYTHGEAVAIGMYGAALISGYLGLCTSSSVEAVRSILLKYRLPLSAPECNANQLYDLLIRDKKAIGGQINWVLMKEIGQVTICNAVPEDIVRKALADIAVSS